MHASHFAAPHAAAAMPAPPACASAQRTARRTNVQRTRSIKQHLLRFHRTPPLLTYSTYSESGALVEVAVPCSGAVARDRAPFGLSDAPGCRWCSSHLHRAIPMPDLRGTQGALSLQVCGVDGAAALRARGRGSRSVQDRFLCHAALSCFLPEVMGRIISSSSPCAAASMRARRRRGAH
jgi:hypothetical protein